MEHPYNTGENLESNDQFSLGYRLIYCPDCKKDIVEEPTAQELKEMNR